jgi:hypothetical protein
MSDTSVGNLTPVGDGLQVGAVLGRSLAVLQRNLPKYLLFGAVISLPDLVETLSYGGMTNQIDIYYHATGNYYHGTGTHFQSTPLDPHGAFALLALLIYAVCQSTMIYGVFQDVRGQPFNLAASISRGLRRFVPVLGTDLCITFLVAVGFVLLIVPGLIFLTMYLVAVPACVVEGLGPIKSLGRSRMLTKGHRWQMLAIGVVPVMVFGATTAFFDTIGLVVAGSTGGAIAGFAAGALVSPYCAIVGILAYHDLRAVKEGLDIEQLAAAFD